MYAAASHSGGVLNGVTEAQWDNREPMAYVTYVEGRRHGLLKTWDEAGEPILFSQYERGKKQGFSCLFDDCLPVMVASIAWTSWNTCS